MQVLIVPDPKLLRLDYGKGRGGGMHCRFSWFLILNCLGWTRWGYAGSHGF